MNILLLRFFIFNCFALWLPVALNAQIISAEETADTVEMSRRAIGLIGSEATLIQNALKQIPKDNLAYIAIHGDKNVFKIVEDNTWKTITHRSLAKWIVEAKAADGKTMVYDGKTIVLLSCSNLLSAEKLATTLANLDKKANKPTHKIIAWEGRVRVYETGYIKGNGLCKQFDPSASTVANRIKTLTGNSIPQGTGKAEGKSVILSTMSDPIEKSIMLKMASNEDECLNFFVNIDDYDTPTLYYTILTEADKLIGDALFRFCKFFDKTTNPAFATLLKAGHYKSALIDPPPVVGGEVVGNIIIKRGTTQSYLPNKTDGIYKARIEIWTGIGPTRGWQPKQDNDGISTFFPDDWKKDQVIEEIALARTKINLSRPEVDGTYIARMTTGNDLVFALKNDGNLLSAYPKL